ncbi:MAG: TonB-dependent receptor domain-containing protein, partial [Syntrophothermus sp.]
MSKIRLSVIITLLLGAVSFAQVRSITGTVKDKQNNTALAGVTVVVMEKGSEKVLAGSATSEKGSFTIKNNIKSNNIFVRISFIGYETIQLDTLKASEGKIELGTVYMSPSAIMTSSVVVKGQRPMVEYFVDKQVINMEKVPGATSGSVTDALKNTGVVEVDPSSNKISVRGNSNVNILIDGKPQPMADNLLAQMPATYVDKVEVVTTPSAKDDPEGDGGTINIVTKKNKMNNYNGSFSLFSSTSQLGFGSLILNYRKNNFNLFTSGNLYLGRFNRNTEGQRRNYNSSLLASQNSLGGSEQKGYMGNFKIGFDYDIDTMNSLSVTGNYNKMNGKMIITSDNTNYNSAGLRTYSYGVDDDGKGDFNNYNFSSNYKKKFDNKGHELTADAYYAGMINSMNDLMTTNFSYNPLMPGLQSNKNDVDNKTFILNTDYVLPSEKLGKLEAGYKFTWRDRTNTLDNLNYSYISQSYYDSLKLSNVFKYEEMINAAYGTYTNKISFIEYKLGFRVEQTKTNGHQVTSGEKFSTDYLSYFPSLGLSYKLTEMFQVSFNAAKKINRPQMDFINPFVKVNGPNNINVGNPKLEPTYVNAYELKFNPFLNLYYTDSKGRPTNITANMQDSITVSTTINSASTKNYGFELTLPIINDPRFPVKLPEWFGMFNLRLTYNNFRE